MKVTDCEWTLAEAKAVQQIALGQADEEQQKRFFRWLMNEACQVGVLSYRSGKGIDDQRDTDFAQGRAFIGFLMARLANTPLEKLKVELNRKKGKTNG